MPDAGLRKIFKTQLSNASWTPIETGGTMAGVPDAEYIFPINVCGWVEFKATKSNRIKRSKSVPFQIAWHERRHRFGGRTFVAVRQMTGRVDTLFIFPGHRMRDLVEVGIDGIQHLGGWVGGPTRWNWKEIEMVLRR